MAILKPWFVSAMRLAKGVPAIPFALKVRALQDAGTVFWASSWGDAQTQWAAWQKGAKPPTFATTRREQPCKKR